jgi:hypothetical protein
MTSATERLLSGGEAARILGVDPRTIVRWANDPRVELTAIRAHATAHRRYRRTEVEALKGTHDPGE